MNKRVRLVISLITAMTLLLFAFGCAPTADPDPETFTITIVNGTGSGTYDEGDSVTATATIPSGKVFVNWTSGSDVISTANPYTFNASKDITLTANFENEPVATYTITIVNGTGSGTYDEGGSVTATATIPSGKVFVNWTSGSDVISTANPYTFNASKDITLTANFENEPVATYTVTVINGTGSGTYDEGGSVTATATIPSGKVFVNWTSGSDVISTANPYTFNASKDITLTANFENEPVATYTVIVEGGYIGDEEDGVTSGTYDEGDEIVVNADIPEGYMFIEWLDEDDESVTTANPYIFTVNHDITLKAVFQEAEADATTYIFEAENADLSNCKNESGNGNNVEDHRGYNYGSTVANQEVYRASNGYAAMCFNNVLNNTIVWTFNSDRDGTAALTIRMANGNWGGSMYKTNPTNLDKTRLGMTVTGGGNTTTIDYAAFTIEGRDLADTGASSGAAYGMFTDYMIALEMPIAEGTNIFTLKLLAIGAGPNVDCLKLTTTANMTWSPRKNGSAPIADYPWNGTAPVTQYTVEVEGGTGGGTYDAGKLITVTATVPEDKEFVSWMSGTETVSTANPYSFTVTKDVSLKAVFQDLQAGATTTYIFEAENADLSNCKNNGWGNSVEDHSSHNYGSTISNPEIYRASNGYAARNFNNTVGNTIVWTFNSDSSGTAALTIRMANGIWGDINRTNELNVSPSRLGMTIAGSETSSTVDYPAFKIEGMDLNDTGASDYAAYGMFADYSITLEMPIYEGVNTFTLELFVIGAGANIDCLKLTTTADLTWTPQSVDGAPIANYPWNINP